MNPEQYQALKSAILADPATQSLAVTNDMPPQNAFEADQAIADALNAPTGSRVVSFHVRDIDLLRELGPATGATFLDAVESASASNSVLKWAFKALLSDIGIDIGHPETRAALDGLASAVPGVAQPVIDKIKALAERPSSLAIEAVGVPVSGADVSIALRNH